MIRQSVLFIIALVIILLFAFSIYTGQTQSTQKKSGWEAPKSTDDLKNPFASDSEAWKAGKTIYGNMCGICHGEKGKGDGIAGITLKPRPSDLTEEKVQEQSDGAIFWKLEEGKPPMASYKELLTDEQRWQLVNYIRQLSKK